MVHGLHRHLLWAMFGAGVLGGCVADSPEPGGEDSRSEGTAAAWSGCGDDDTAEESEVYLYPANHGRVDVYEGCTTGLSATRAWTVAASGGSLARLGFSVGSAGDVNGDGYGDVVVGSVADRWATDGMTSVHLGGPAGLEPAPAWIVESDQEAVYFGRSVDSAGDTNADGYGDVIVGAMYFEDGEEHEGAAYLYLGSAAGLGGTAVWIAQPDRAEAHFGCSVASAGDVNGDGYGDVVVGAYGERRAYLYLGSAAGPASGAAWTAHSENSRSYLGSSVAAAGDVNGDGYEDVVIGGDAGDRGGLVHLYLGSALGLSANAVWSQESDETSFGSSVATGGDVNGDGYADILIGEAGYAHLYLGSAGGLATDAAWSQSSGEECGGGVPAVASAGDINGDGYGDIVIAEFGCELALVFAGSASGPATEPTATVLGDEAGWWRGAASAGDVNGDRYDDLVVSMYGYTHDTSD